MQDLYDDEIIVPYFLQQSLSSMAGKIENAMTEIEDNSRVVFVLKNYNNREFLRIVKGDGCYFSPYDCLGRSRQMGCQPTVSIGVGCTSHGTILHELLHAIGFQHEHQRPGRNRYVKILWQNIEEDEEDQFHVLPKREFVWSVDEFEFDFASVMLYDGSEFSINGRPTMKALGGRHLSSNKNRLSRMDKAKLDSL